MTKRKKTQKSYELADFIESNHKLLSVLGIFTALTVFANTLEPRPLGSVLSFLFLSLCFLVWLEVWRKFPGKGGSDLVSYFETLLTITITVVGIYWLLSLYKIYRQGIFVLIFGLTLWLISGIIKKFSLFRRFFGPGKKTRARYIVGLFIVSVCAIVALLLSSLLLPLVTELLESFEAYLLLY